MMSETKRGPHGEVIDADGEVIGQTRVIWKYVVPVRDGGAQHAIPEGARLLDVQMQNGLPTMWWSVPLKDTHPSTWPLRTFVIVGTGPPGFTDRLHYVGTVQDGPYVWHVMSWEPVPRDTATAS